MKIEITKEEGIEALGKKLKEVTKVMSINSAKLLVMSDHRPDLCTDDVLEACRSVSKELDRPVFCAVNNVKGTFTPTGGILETPFSLMLCELNSKEVRFFNEVKAGRPGSSSKFKSADFLDVSGNFHIEGERASTFCKAYFEMESDEEVETLKKDLASGRNLNVEGMLLPLLGTRGVVRSKAQTLDWAFIVVRYSPEEDDLSFLSDALPLIKGPNDLALLWDFERDCNPWSEIETFIYLLALFYMELGQSCYNLIIFGARSSKKTAVLTPLEWIFNTDVIQASGVRGKALVPHWGDNESDGMLIEAKFVAPIDELFRKFSQEEGFIQSYRSIKKGLEQMMNLIDREDHVEGTGRGTKKVRLRNSIIATDNLADESITALRQINKIDAPIIKRYSILRLSKDSEKAGEKMYNLTSEEVKPLLLQKLKKVGLDFKKYAILGRLIRYEMQKVVKFDVVRVREIAQQCVDEVRVRIGGEGNIIEYDFHKKIRAIMKSVVILNSIFKNNHIVAVHEASEEDYKQFEVVFKRLTEDHFKIFCESVSGQRELVGEKK
jgi:hypothetical protein